MNLRNKKTGETGYYLHTHRDHNTGTLKVAVLKDGVPFSEFKPHEPIYDYDSLAELNDDWEDALDTIWYIAHDGSIHSADIGNNWTREKNIGNYFGTREEAEKAVERLKAWKRLKDAGLKFKDWNKSNYDRKFCINAEVEHDAVAFEFFKDLRVALDMEISDEAQK